MSVYATEATPPLQFDLHDELLRDATGRVVIDSPSPKLLEEVADKLHLIAHWAWPDDRADWTTSARSLRAWANTVRGGGR